MAYSYCIVNTDYQGKRSPRSKQRGYNPGCNIVECMRCGILYLSKYISREPVTNLIVCTSCLKPWPAQDFPEPLDTNIIPDKSWHVTPINDTITPPVPPVNPNIPQAPYLW